MDGQGRPSTCTWCVGINTPGVDIFARRHQVHAGAGVHVGGGEELQGEVHVQVAAVGRHRFQRDLVVAQEAQRGWIMDTTMVYCSSDSKKNLVMVG
jgi:hypothetical protein